MRNVCKMTLVGALSVVSMGVTGCPPPPPGGGVRLTLLIDRDSGVGTAGVFGSVTAQQFPFNLVQLDSDQHVLVNGTPIGRALGLFDGSVTAINAPDGYTVAYNNKGTIKSQVVTPPADFSTLTPADGSSVSRKGFDITYSPSGDPNVRIDVEIRGSGPDGSDDDTRPDSVSKSISDQPDNGVVKISESDFAGFLNGSIQVRISRYQRFTLDIGFDEGSVRVSIVKSLALNLTN